MQKEPWQSESGDEVRKQAHRNARSMMCAGARMRFERALKGKKQEGALKSLIIALYFMATHSGQYSVDSKIKMLQHVKKSWKTRNRIDAREKKKVAPCDYIEELPGDPEKLLESDQYKRSVQAISTSATFKIDGCWTKCPLKQMDLHFLDNSYQCRGGGMASNPLLQHLLDMHSSMMRSMRQPAVEDEDECKIRYQATENLVVGLEMMTSEDMMMVISEDETCVQLLKI